MLLLEYGANINSVSADGSTPLTTAIIYNSHNVLRLFLDRWHEYSICPRMKVPNLLQIAALYADPSTLQILAATDHFRRRYDKQYTLGDFGHHLKQRPDFTEKLALAFDELLSVVNQVPEVRKEISPIFADSGLLSWCLFRSNSGFNEFQDPGSASSSDGSFYDAIEKHPVITESFVAVE
ncbi:uncharacterized protein N7479_009487 [Penicillium vulpinum]|uniref:Uncharacterized protein n=1 Tax=Penicillium vulpinum TaxID=29845 RepID=A0A1V6RBJ4_9EURO|nr:uncharacterized protein N7479_009487 [Penicillium vulpinum]KAJ5951074.1 hypothetical protein N7479_009487 [Penicillium vulpinum]OQD98631.1 hypothetical protein PENVUL_c069G07978 [Penicillium vulpinum]